MFLICFGFRASNLTPTTLPYNNPPIIVHGHLVWNGRHGSLHRPSQDYTLPGKGTVRPAAGTLSPSTNLTVGVTDVGSYLLSPAPNEGQQTSEPQAQQCKAGGLRHNAEYLESVEEWGGGSP